MNLDIIFRLAIGAGFAYLIIAAQDFPRSSFGDPATYPVFVGVIGLTLWALSSFNQVMLELRGKTQGRIYDIAFDTADLPSRTVWLRTLWVFVILGTILLAVWLVNFHVAIPLFLLLYLRFVGKTRWRSAITIAIAMEIPIVVLYGRVINTVWPNSVLESVLNIDFQSWLEGPLAQWL